MCFFYIKLSKKIINLLFFNIKQLKFRLNYINLLLILFFKYDKLWMFSQKYKDDSIWKQTQIANQKVLEILPTGKFYLFLLLQLFRKLSC